MNIDVKNDDEIIEDITLNYDIYRCINNEYTPKNGNFF